MSCLLGIGNFFCGPGLLIGVQTIPCRYTHSKGFTSSVIDVCVCVAVGRQSLCSPKWCPSGVLLANECCNWMQPSSTYSGFDLLLPLIGKGQFQCNCARFRDADFVDSVDHIIFLAFDQFLASVLVVGFLVRGPGWFRLLDGVRIRGCHVGSSGSDRGRDSHA